MANTTTEVAEMIELLAANGYTMKHLADLVRGLEVITSEIQTQDASEVIKSRVTKILNELHFHQSTSGYPYLRDAIIMKYSEETCELKLCEIYERLVKEHSLGQNLGRKIESNIRYAIQEAFSEGKDTTWKNYFKEEIWGASIRPNNRKFITAVVAYLYEEDNKTQKC